MDERERTATIVSKFGTKVDAEWEDDGRMHITVFIGGNSVESAGLEDTDIVLLVDAYTPLILSQYPDIREVVTTIILPFVFDLYIIDPYLRLRLFYEFGIIEKVKEGDVLSEGDYYIAVEKLYDSGVAKLELIGCCPDGSSYFTPESARKAYELLECHSCDSVGLPLLDTGQIKPSKCVLFRLE